MNVLRWAHPCQGPQCLSPIEVAMPSLGESLRDYKAFLRVWMLAVYTENICYNSLLHPNVYRLKDGSLQGLLLHAEPASIFSCMQ